MVVGQLPDPRAADEIGAAIADMGECGARFSHQQRDQGRAHATVLGAKTRRFVDFSIRCGDGVAKFFRQTCACTFERLDRPKGRLGGELARDLARYVATETIGHDEETLIESQGVVILIGAAALAHVGSGGSPKNQRIPLGRRVHRHRGEAPRLLPIGRPVFEPEPFTTPLLRGFGAEVWAGARKPFNSRGACVDNKRRR